jgi:hypothetical protein
MDRTSRSFEVFILIMAISSLGLLIVKPAEAQMLSTPIFTAKVIDGSYTIPTTYSTDPYTGAQITNGGYTVLTKNVTITIQNVPQANWYLLEYKGHYSSDWVPVYTWGTNVTISASSGTQTILTISSNNHATYGDNNLDWGKWAFSLAPNSQIDFRLKAINGQTWISPLLGANHPFIVGNASPWSNIQTITIGETSTNTSPNPTSTSTQNPTPTPTIPEFPIMAILPFFVSVLLVAVYLKHRRTNYE